MAEESAQPTAPAYGQLTQKRVPLYDAADAFADQDANGRVPIVVIPQRLYRYLNGLVIGAGAVLGACLLGAALFDVDFLVPLGIVLSIVLLALGIMRWFTVQVPEGVSALLARGGRHERVIGSGIQFVPPYLAVTHLVTRREIPFDVPLVEARTADDVRAQVDTLVTFSITDPARFVFRIIASDYDQVFQAACQEALRALIRSVPANQLSDLVGQDAEGLRARIEAVVSAYGVTIHRVIITFVQLPEDFLHTQEERQLAVLQCTEQEEKQALALRRQADAEELVRQQGLARAEREREAMEARLRGLSAQRRVVAEEAAIEAERLARLEERLHNYPQAAQWEWEGAQLDVARALASNTRAILNVGSAGEIARALVMREGLIEPHVLGPGAGADNRRIDSPQDAAPREELWLPDGIIPAEATKQE